MVVFEITYRHKLR